MIDRSICQFCVGSSLKSDWVPNGHGQKSYQQQSQEENVLGLSRGSGGLVLQKFLKISGLDWQKLHFEELS